MSPLLGDDELLDEAGNKIPTGKIASVVSNIPQLGVSGNGGLVQDVVGKDVVGNLIGTSAPIPRAIDGGQNGLLGKTLDGASPVTQAVQSIAANPSGTNPIATVQGLTGSIPGVSNTVSTITGALPAGGGSPTAMLGSVVPSVTAPVGSILNKATGAIPVPAGVTTVTGTLKTVVAGTVSTGLPGRVGSVLGGLH